MHIKDERPLTWEENIEFDTNRDRTPFYPASAEFLRQVHPDTDGFLELRAFGDGQKAQHFVPLPLDDAAMAKVQAFASAYRKDRNVYHGIATRATKADGTLDNCSRLNALYIEIDLKHGVPLRDIWNRLTLEPTMPFASNDDALAHGVLLPSAIIHSGGGLHVYWLLSEPLDLTTPLGRARAYQWLGALAHKFGGDNESTEPARILRVPDTFNHKPQYQRPGVTLLTYDWNRKYSLNQVIAALGEADPSRAAASVVNNPGPIAHNFDEHTRIKMAQAWLERQAPAVEGQGGDKQTYNVCCAVAHGHDLSEDNALVALQKWNARCTPPWPDWALRGKIRNAIRYASGPRGAKLEARAGRIVRLTPAASIKPKHVLWLWDSWIPKGMFGLLGGREGLGKSFETLWTAAQLTRGELDGSFKGTPRTVLIAATEDSWEHTIVPRLLALDADLSRIHRVDVETTTGAVEIMLPIDIDGLKDIIKEMGDVALLILDPLISRLSGKLDTHKDAEVRRALEPLVQLADDTDIAIIGIIHVNKSVGADPLNMIMGSRAFPAVARFVHFVVEDPSDESQSLFGLIKINVSQRNHETRVFHIVKATVSVDGEQFETAKFEWTGTDPRTVREIMQEVMTMKKSNITGDAARWLKTYLQQNGGQADSAKLKADAAAQGFKDSTLRRARQKLNIHEISSGFPRKTIWVLPGNSVVPGGFVIPFAP